MHSTENVAGKFSTNKNQWPDFFHIFNISVGCKRSNFDATYHTEKK